MNSKISAKDREALIGLNKSMTAEQRLVAFLNHSRLIHRLARAGRAFRKKPSAKPRIKRAFSK